MIQDTARISLHDGTQKTAIEVYPGGQLLSFGRKATRAQVLDRAIESKVDVICILLGNGQKLTGSRDQLVAVQKAKTVQYRPLADIEIGDKLRGERAGMPVIVAVIGLAFEPKKEVRLVSFDLRGKNFVAEGILCR